MSPLHTTEMGALPPRPLPDEALYEIVDGQPEELPPMGTYASILASRLVMELVRYAEPHQLGQAIVQCLFSLEPTGRRQRRPDAAFVSYRKWPKDRLFPLTDTWPVVPELAVEVVSPNDLADSVQAKVKEYLRAGVQLVWVVYPQQEWVLVYESLSQVRGLSATDSLDGGTVLPGFSLPLRDLFTQPPAADMDADADANNPS